MLNLNAVTARVIGRGKHFHLVEQESHAALSTATFGLNGNATATAPPLFDTMGPSDPPLQSDGVAFVLRPPTVPKEDCGQINEAVHLEWLKGRGAAWVSGSPDVQYCKKNGSFQIRVMDLASPSPDPSANLITESGLAAALDTLEDAALDECVSRHLTEGGDDRLHLSKEGVNKYYCPPRPLPADVVVRGSCTCSAPTPDGFEAARHLLRNLWSGHTSFAQSTDDIRKRLSSVLEISVPHEVILHPSGSDAELIPLAVASFRARELNCSKLINIVAAAGEVGSGTAPAAAGRHFSGFAPCGGLVKTGDTLDEFPTAVNVIEMKPRDAFGNIIRNYDELVMNHVKKCLETEEKPYFVIHAVDGSKTGLRLPTPELLETLINMLGDQILIVMDACQCRSEAEELNWFLELGAIILITASKFYSAPGFCGAVLVPLDSAQVLAKHPAPVGLSDYLTKYEVPASLPSLRDRLPAAPKNVGLLLRWACGMAEMEMFAALGNSVKLAIRDWVYGVRKLVCSRSPELDLIDIDCEACVGDETRSGGVNSVVSIKFLSKCGSAHLDANTLRRMHRLLTIDASDALPAEASEADRKIASLRCMVGQPVKLGSYGVLRLAIGAPMAREIARSGYLERALEEDARILDKMVVLGKYCEQML